MGLSASRRYFSTAAGVYSSLDARSPSRARDLLKRPACGRPTRCEDAAPKSPEALSQFTRTEPSPADVRETVRRRAWVTGARGKNATGAARTTRRRGSTGNESSSLGSSPRRDRHRARDRRSAAAGRAGLSFPLCGSLPSLSLSIDDAEHRRRPVRGPPACSSAGTEVSAAAAAAALCKESHLSAPARRPDDDPAVPSGPGPAMAASRGRGAAVEDPLRRGCLFRGGAAGRQPCSHVHGLAATFSTSTMPRKTVFEPQKLKPSVEELNMLK